MVPDPSLPLLAAVKEKTPIVVVDGSGQAADVLAYAYNFMHNPLYDLPCLARIVERHLVWAQ